jgi:arylsulfatase A-like enzyme
MEDHAKTADPFFLFLSFGPPHFPYDTAPEKYQDRYRQRDLQLRPNVPENSRQQAITALRGYYAHMAALDDCVQQLLSTLERLKIGDDTIVVFTSDHGDMMLSQGLTTKLYPWDESVRIPFLLRYPRELGRQGRRVQRPLEMPDMMPTLLSLAKLDIPGAVQGHDLTRYLRGQQDDPDFTAFINLPVPITEARRYGFAEYRGLRNAWHTYVRSIDGPWLLYDNMTDPYQMHNLCHRPEATPIRSAMDASLNKRLRELNDDFLPAHEYVKRAGLGHYREVNVPVGHTESPWGDWESTLRT